MSPQQRRDAAYGRTCLGAKIFTMPLLSSLWLPNRDSNGTAKSSPNHFGNLNLERATACTYPACAVPSLGASWLFLAVSPTLPRDNNQTDDTLVFRHPQVSPGTVGTVSTGPRAKVRLARLVRLQESRKRLRSTPSAVGCRRAGIIVHAMIHLA